MTQRFWVIGYRPPSQNPLFFRGDGRYAIRLPAIDRLGWVEDIGDARLFAQYPDFNPNSISKTLDADQITVYPYKGSVGKKNVIKPTVRPDGYKNRFRKREKEARKERTVPKK